MSEGARITGTVREDAHVLFTGGNQPSAMLVFEVWPAKGLPYRVCKPLGTDATVQECAKSTAKLLKRGCAVAFYAQGFRAQSDHGHAHLYALGVTDVLPLEVPQTRTQEA